MIERLCKELPLEYFVCSNPCSLTLFSPLGSSLNLGGVTATCACLLHTLTTMQAPVYELVLAGSWEQGDKAVPRAQLRVEHSQAAEQHLPDVVPGGSKVKANPLCLFSCPLYLPSEQKS